MAEDKHILCETVLKPQSPKRLKVDHEEETPEGRFLKTGLITKRFPPKSIREGVHRITENSSFHFVKNAVICTEADTKSLWDCYETVPPSPNPMKKGTFLNRRQGTYGTPYTFGAQTSPCLGSVKDAPPIVEKCVAFAQLYCITHFPLINTELYTMAHCNWYPNGSAAIGFHQDAEHALVKGHPIFSFTFIDNDDGPLYRYFTVANDRAAKDVVAELALPHRCCLVMAGDFQKELYHGVSATTRKAFKTQRRFNVTVRAHNPRLLE